MSRIRTLAVTAATVLVVGAPTAASAATWSHTDPSGDVVRYTYDPETEEETEAVDPSVVEGDVIGSTVKHNPRKVLVTLRFRELTPSADVSVAMFSFRTNEGLNRDFTVASDESMPEGAHELSKPSGSTVRCSGARHSIDYEANSVSVSVPRSCLSRPRWVSAGAGALRLVGGEDATVFEVLGDDAHSPKIGDSLVYSPRLRRG